MFKNVQLEFSIISIRIFFSRKREIDSYKRLHFHLREEVPKYNADFLMNFCTVQFRNAK